MQYANGQTAADFIRVTCWQGTADFVCKYFQKGSLIALTGRIQTEQWTDQQGRKRTSTGVVANSVSFAGLNRNQQGQNGGYAQQPQYAQPQAQQPQYAQQPQQGYAQMPANNGYQQQPYAPQAQPAQQVGMDMGFGEIEDGELPF